MTPPHAEMPATVLLLGDPQLRRVSEPVLDVHDPDFLAKGQRLRRALDAFRNEHGFGRAIAAPQIGIAQRFIAVHLPSYVGLLINPAITWRSAETFTMWDDCMSFPSLFVRVRRHDAISVSFLDESGQPCMWSKLDRATSELLQHEIDHLDGILSFDRIDSDASAGAGGVGRDAIVLRDVFEKDPAYFRKQVHYVIGDGA
ncbi:peptide deformylase [Pendulispora albinea]|uniref:Peptide deformylase n=1 Tax=Pendulispora albinea TaxID=2741071 RepID=A0ABZ2LTS5_9BACT